MEFIKKDSKETGNIARCSPQPCSGNCSNQSDNVKVANSSEKKS